MIDNNLLQFMLKDYFCPATSIDNRGGVYSVQCPLLAKLFFDIIII